MNKLSDFQIKSSSSEFLEIAELYNLAKSVRDIYSRIDLNRLEFYNKRKHELSHTVFNQDEMLVNTSEHVRFRISDDAVHVTMIFVQVAEKPFSLYSFKFGQEERMESEYYKTKYNKPIKNELQKLISVLEAAEKQFNKEDDDKRLLIEAELDKILLGEQE